MEKYTVTVVSILGQERPQLLIPLPGSSTVAALIEEVIRRSAKKLAQTIEGKLNIHLNTENGPILDDDEMLIDSPENTSIFAVSSYLAHFQHNQWQPSTNLEKVNTLPVTGTSGVKPDEIGLVLAADGNGIKIRVITPALA